MIPFSGEASPVPAEVLSFHSRLPGIRCDWEAAHLLQHFPTPCHSARMPQPLDEEPDDRRIKLRQGTSAQHGPGTIQLRTQSLVQDENGLKSLVTAVSVRIAHRHHSMIAKKHSAGDNHGILPSAMRPLFLFAISSIFSATVEAQTVSLVSIGYDQGVEHVVLAETAVEGKLTLLPGHSFFSGGKGAKLTSESSAPDELNGNKQWSRIEGLRSTDQRVVFPLWLHTDGGVKGKITGSGRFTVSLGEKKVSGTGSFEFPKVKSGRMDLILVPEEPATIERIELSGTGIMGAQLLRARWRPAAIHSAFGSSELGSAKSRLWIMEVRPIHGEKDFYSPITTPFGYFGSTFNADHTSGGINFSMWSYQRGAAEPPVQQLSHLLAVGHPQATFGHFDHEGTGVKLRDWNPYEGQKIASTVLALRVEPGQPYDTYTGWFLDQQTRLWRLYASGRKWSGKGSVTSLLPGSFVEVPGPPHLERTGHLPRAADFRGWCRDDSGEWHLLDVMNGSKADAKRGHTNCMWARSEDGWFRMAMGGMTHYRYPGGVDVSTTRMKTLPDYMSGSALKTLALPTSIAVKSIVRQGTRVHLELELKSTAKGRSKTKVFFGPEDALTFDQRWAKSHDLGELAPGVQRTSFDGAPPAGFCRVLVTNDTGSYFSKETIAWQ